MVEILPAAPPKADFFCDLFCQTIFKNQVGLTAHQRFDEKHKEKAEQREHKLDGRVGGAAGCEFELELDLSSQCCSTPPTSSQAIVF